MLSDEDLGQKPEKWETFEQMNKNLEAQKELLNKISVIVSQLVSKNKKDYINAVLVTENTVSEATVQAFITLATGSSKYILNAGGTKSFGGIDYLNWHFKIKCGDWDKIYNRLYELGVAYWLYDYDEVLRRAFFAV